MAKHASRRLGSLGSLRAIVWALVAVAVLAVATWWGAVSLGRWLVVSDPPDHAAAVVVLNGHIPFRAMEAASLYRDGWVREVWLLPTEASAEAAALVRLGIRVPTGETYNRAVLDRLGVPQRAVRTLEGMVRNTRDEVRTIDRELRRQGGRRVIVVTSKPHTRRVRATWRAIAPDLDARVRYPSDDPFEPDGWWRRTGDALAVSREVFGLLNVWTGFVVKPDSP